MFSPSHLAELAIKKVFPAHLAAMAYVHVPIFFNGLTKESAFFIPLFYKPSTWPCLSDRFCANLNINHIYCFSVMFNKMTYSDILPVYRSKSTLRESYRPHDTYYLLTRDHLTPFPCNSMLPFAFCDVKTCVGCMWFAILQFTSTRAQILLYFLS